MKYNKICVVGLGYIGLPTAAVFAANGKSVVGLEVSQSVVNTVNDGCAHIVEPGLDTLIREVVAKGTLKATIVPEPADCFIIAVPTPFKGGDRQPDLSFIQAACRSIAPVLTAGTLVILESTSPVGATEQMEFWLAEARPDLSFPSTLGDASDIRIAHCPERVLPGKILHELVHNDRVIGGITKRCALAAAELYRSFVQGECVIASSARTAEMTKLTENSFRDVNIAFANELSLICERLEIDVWELIRLANRHPRVDVLRPGPGVGGHCIAVDPWFIVASSREEAKIISTARMINDDKPLWVVSQIDAEIGRQKQISNSSNIKIALLGLSFKPDIDDLRESPALQIASILADRQDIELMCVEPHIDVLPDKLGSKAQLHALNSAIEAAHMVVILVAHTGFKELNVSALDKPVLDFVGLHA